MSDELSQHAACRKKAMDLLARRPHFRRELADKLTKRGFSEEEIATQLDRLQEENLLNDRRLARDTVERRVEREGIGRRTLWAYLMRHGAESEVVEEALAAAYPEDDFELAEAATERWLGRTTKPERARLARHLQQRGYSSASIGRLIRTIPWTPE